MAYTTINKSSEYFNTKLYTGDNTATSYTGVGFQPDFIWIKDRSQTADHTLIDSVRGVKKVILSNSTAAEGTDGATQGLNSFDSDGFTLGTNSNVGSTNNTGDNYVAWNWLANGAGVSNTDGDITSTVSASTTSGFSIVTYTGNSTAGATIGHGLGVAPSMVIFKKLNGTSAWSVYHKSLGNGYFINLQDTGGSTLSSTFLNNTSPSSSLITLGDADNGNTSGATYVAYCFAEKKGYSKFGSYTGNGSTDGTFIYTGMKPAFVIHKKTDSAGYSWLIHDNKRPDYNSTDKILEADLASVEQSNYHMDLLSNGFKHRITSGSTNASGGTYIYMAFAENPLVGTNNIPATAR
jgi:hypothetical protein